MTTSHGGQNSDVSFSSLGNGPVQGDSTRPRVALVEDIAALRDGFPQLLPQLDFVATVERAEELTNRRPVADIVLLDLHLANSSQPMVTQGLEAVRQVVAAGYLVCLYTQEERRFVLAACLAAGARGLVSKSSSPAVVGEAVGRVLAGEVVMPQQIIGLAEVLSRRGSLTLLSPRQRELLAGRARGLTYAEIAKTMYVAESTLRWYWQDLSQKVAQHLRETAPSDIERVLGLAPGDLLSQWPSD
ncbi:MAG: response regulator transcription factor [Actinomycetota bacterium]